MKTTFEKKLYAEQKHSTSEIQRQLGLGHYTLYEYINHPEKIKNMTFELCEKIADFEGVDTIELRKKMTEYLAKGGNNSEL